MSRHEGKQALTGLWMALAILAAVAALAYRSIDAAGDTRCTSGDRGDAPCARSSARRSSIAPSASCSAGKRSFRVTTSTRACRGSFDEYICSTKTRALRPSEEAPRPRLGEHADAYPFGL
jgi:hypothetical protein